jgi:hypothetical protein
MIKEMPIQKGNLNEANRGSCIRKGQVPFYIITTNNYNRMKKIIFLITIIATLLVSGCSEDEFLRFDSESNSAINILTSSASVNFAFKAPEEIADTVNINIRLMGAPVDYDRYFELEIVDSITTGKEGVHFAKLQNNYLLSAMEYETSFPIVALRSSTLKDSTYQLGVKIKDNDYFSVGAVDYQTAIVQIKDFDSEPEWWGQLNGVLIASYYGRYHPEKLRIFWEIWEVPEEERQDWEIPLTPINELMAKLILAKAYFEENEFYHEDGERVVIPFNG